MVLKYCLIVIIYTESLQKLEEKPSISDNIKLIYQFKEIKIILCLIN